MTTNTLTTVAVLALVCENDHRTELNLITPNVRKDGTVAGLAGSQADYCDVCDSDVMDEVGVELRDVVLSEDDAAIYRVWTVG